MIPVFSAEKDLVDVIQSNSSIAYLSPLTQLDVPEKLIASISDSLKSVAGQSDEDLYKTLSILVTTSWNKNDDIFGQEEVWVARNTPEHKQTNIEHDDDKIVGHIVGNWPVDEKYEIIDADTPVDLLPFVFHIVTAGVIYKQRNNPETKKEVEELIANIENGNKFVSMECIFKGFDYGVLSSEGIKHIVQRTAKSAFLTKHLKAYGGSGEYDGYRIGRILRNITFSGKGYVDKPANPDSIIFDKNDLINFSNATETNPFELNGVITCSVNSELSGETVMADNQLEQLKAENEKLKSQLAQADSKKLESQIEVLAGEKAELEAKLSELGDTLGEVTKSRDEVQKSHDEMQKSRDEVQKSYDEMEKSLSEMKLEAQNSNRISVLVDGGVDKEIAKTKVDLYHNLNDEQFEALAQDIISAVKPVIAEEVDDTTVIDTATPNVEPDLTAASDDEEDELQTVRAGLAEWASSEFSQGS